MALYQYPSWVKSVKVISSQINQSETNKVYVSLLEPKNPKYSSAIDIRVWINEEPTIKGVFVSYRSLGVLMNILHQYCNPVINWEEWKE